MKLQKIPFTVPKMMSPWAEYINDEIPTQVESQKNEHKETICVKETIEEYNFHYLL